MFDANIQISIIVTIYNVEEYLRRCIESILIQSYTNIDIVLVDDGSTDGCSEICDYYACIDNRVQVIHKKNGGVVSARKAGTAVAKGDYVISVDGDDWIEKDRIKVLVNEGITPYKPDMIYLSGRWKDFEGNSVLVDENIPIKTFYGDEIKNEVFPLLIDVNKVFAVKTVPALWSWAIKRELLQIKQKIIDERIVVGDDEICIWLCLLSAKCVTLIKQNGYHYIQRKSSILYTAAALSKDHDLRMRIWYQQLKKYLDSYKATRKINQLFQFATIRLIMMADYELLLKSNEDFLFPFPKVRKGHKIIIYGAGKIGYSLMRYLADTKNFHVMLWVDQNEKRYALPGYKISSVEAIPKVDYDYIVIAILNVDVVQEIKKSLILKGIPEEKIATMDASVITEEAIPSVIRKAY